MKEVRIKSMKHLFYSFGRMFIRSLHVFDNIPFSCFIPSINYWDCYCNLKLSSEKYVAMSNLQFGVLINYVSSLIKLFSFTVSLLKWLAHFLLKKKMRNHKKLTHTFIIRTTLVSSTFLIRLKGVFAKNERGIGLMR